MSSKQYRENQEENVVGVRVVISEHRQGGGQQAVWGSGRRAWQTEGTGNAKAFGGYHVFCDLILIVYSKMILSSQ